MSARSLNIRLAFSLKLLALALWNAEDEDEVHVFQVATIPEIIGSYLDFSLFSCSSFNLNSKSPLSFCSTAIIAPFPHTADIMSRAEGVLQIAQKELFEPLVSEKAIFTQVPHS